MCTALKVKVACLNRICHLIGSQWTCLRRLFEDMIFVDGRTDRQTDRSAVTVTVWMCCKKSTISSLIKKSTLDKDQLLN